MTSYNIDVIINSYNLSSQMYRIEQLKQLEPEHYQAWKVLWDSTPDAHFFNSPSWFSSYLDAFGDQKYIVFFCYFRDELVAVVPLVETRKYGIKSLASVAKGQKFLDRSTLLLAKKDPALAGYLLKKIGTRYNLYLAELEETNANVFMNSGQNQFAAFSVVCPRMNIGNDVLATLSRKQKKSLKKKIMKNEKNITFEMHRDHLGQHLATMFELERRSHKRSKGISIFEKQDLRKLYRSLVKHAKEHIGIAFLHHQGTPIAHRFGYIYKGTFLSVHVAFDDQFRKLGPGKLLLYYCLDYFRKNKIRVLDFSVGDNYLKSQFSDGKISQYHIFYGRSAYVRSWWLVMNGLKKTFNLLGRH